MKDQYVGDINDYLKYALLRSLRSEGEDTAVVWMLTPGDGRSDGRRLGYLTRPLPFRAIDPPLFDELRQLVENGQRNVNAIEASGILPDAIFFADELSDGLIQRNEYMGRALAIARSSRLIFFDPDNGLDVPSALKGRLRSSKYVFRDEIATAYALGNSVAIYQHFPRRPRELFLRSAADGLRECVGCPSVLALTTPHVAFLVLPQEGTEAALHARVQELSERAEPLGAGFVRLG